jgi:hypothetical protein
MPDNDTDLQGRILSKEAIMSGVIVIEDGYICFTDGSHRESTNLEGQYCNLDCLVKYIKEQKEPN